MCARQQNSHKRMIYLTKAKLVGNIFNISWGEGEKPKLLYKNIPDLYLIHFTVM